MINIPLVSMGFNSILTIEKFGLSFHGDQLHTPRTLYPRNLLLLDGNIRIDLKEIIVNSKSLIYSAQDRDYWRTIMNSLLNLQISQAYSFFICFAGEVIAAQCTATFFKISCAPPNLDITRT